MITIIVLSLLFLVIGVLVAIATGLLAIAPWLVVFILLDYFMLRAIIRKIRRK